MRELVEPLIGWSIGTALALVAVVLFVPPHASLLATVIGGVGGIGGLLAGTLWQELHLR